MNTEPAQSSETVIEDNFEPELVVATTTSPYTAFETAVVARVTEIFSEVGVPDDLIKLMGPGLAMKLDQCLHKFARGQITHGGDIRHRDIQREVWNEVMDLLMYLLISDIQSASSIVMNIES